MAFEQENQEDGKIGSRRCVGDEGQVHSRHVCYDGTGVGRAVGGREVGGESFLARCYPVKHP